MEYVNPLKAATATTVPHCSRPAGMSVKPLHHTVLCTGTGQFLDMDSACSPSADGASREG